MIILPAIDIKDGRCVRLYQGDYDQVTTYDDDPVRVALRWQEAGAQWLHVVDLDAVTLAQELSTPGVQRFIYTDIARDGSLQGPNIEALQAMQHAISCAVIASGGVSSLADLRALATVGVEGAIVGKAIYTGDVDL